MPKSSLIFETNILEECMFATSRLYDNPLCFFKEETKDQKFVIETIDDIPKSFDMSFNSFMSMFLVINESDKELFSNETYIREHAANNKLNFVRREFNSKRELNEFLQEYISDIYSYYEDLPSSSREQNLESMFAKYLYNS